MVPTPTPAPPMPIQAIPAPMYFAAIGSMRNSFSEVWSTVGPSVARVNCIVEIDAGEDGENIGLQECHKQFKSRKRDGKPERQHRAEPAEDAEPAEHGDEATKYFQRYVTGQHVGEQPHAVGDRTR